MTTQTDAKPAGNTWPTPMLIDAHVHLYHCFDRTTFFDAALANFKQAAQSLGLGPDTPGIPGAPGCLMLAETASDHAFDSLLAEHELDNGRWRFHPTDESQSLIAAHQGQDRLIVIAGRQIITREGLEVLSLCSTQEYADGQPAQCVIEKIIENNALPVLPYGVGKWSGARGDLVDQLMQGPLGSRLVLGDNAGRLAIAAAPKQFKTAHQRDIRILPGTDPLPFASQACRVGRFGLVLVGEVDRATPAASVKRLIETGDHPPKTFGQAAGLAGFLASQTRMQLRKRTRSHLQK